MMHLLRATLAVILATSYLTLAVLSPRAATASAVWLAYVLVGGSLGVLDLRGNGRR